MAWYSEFWSPFHKPTFWGFGLINAKNCGKSTFKKRQWCFLDLEAFILSWEGTQINRQLHTTSNPWIHLDSYFSVSREPQSSSTRRASHQVVTWRLGQVMWVAVSQFGMMRNATSCNLNIFSSTCRRYVYLHISLFLKYVEFKDHACGM